MEIFFFLPFFTCANEKIRRQFLGVASHFPPCWCIFSLVSAAAILSSLSIFREKCWDYRYVPIHLTFDVGSVYQIGGFRLRWKMLFPTESFPWSVLYLNHLCICILFVQENYIRH